MYTVEKCPSNLERVEKGENARELHTARDTPYELAFPGRNTAWIIY